GIAPSGQAVVGFDLNGDPVYGDVNWHKDGTENISYTGAGNVGIGTDTPAFKLDIQSGSISSSLDNTWNLHVTNTFTNTAQQHSAFIGLRARGNHTAPQYPQLGDTLASFIGRDSIEGLTTATAYGGAAITMTATENFDATHKGTNITFSTTNNGNMLPTDKMTIDHNGNVGIGISIPTTKLDVNGAVKVSEGLDVGNLGGAYTYITLRDDESLNGKKYIHANSNVIGFLNGLGNWLSYWDQNGNQYNMGQVTATRLNSTVGGVSFPDGTVQTTAAVSGGNESNNNDGPCGYSTHWCGWSDNLKCHGVDPYCGCPVGFHQIHWLVSFGNGHLYMCAKD
ncbi:hypothetical protein HOO68_06185, partial [Candidatus Gracilibacteria bacterium]|nr:hypothetical protein [Candidatus Gracilibacteria bacterium]